MANKLIYLTTNPHKIEEANHFFGEKYGFVLDIMNPDFEILEIQAPGGKRLDGKTFLRGSRAAGKQLT